MSQRDELLQEIADSLLPPGIDRADGWFTIQDVMDVRTDLTRVTAARRLDKQVKQGELEMTKKYDRAVSRVVNCYKKL